MTLTLTETQEKASSWRLRPGSRRFPLIIAHRGASSWAPENTQAAFRQAIATGCDGIELDVRLTRDRQLIVFHDRLLDRTSDGCGPVDGHTLAEMRALDAGTWFGPAFHGEPPPTLEEVFESVPRDYLLIVELKVVTNGIKLIAQRVVEAIHHHQRWITTMVSSFNPLALYCVRRMEPRIVRAYNWSKYHPYPLRARWFSFLAQPHWFDPADDSYTPQLHRRFHRQGKAVLAWDVEFNCDLSHMVSARLDAVVGDNPGALVEQKRILLDRPDLSFPRDSAGFKG